MASRSILIALVSVLPLRGLLLIQCLISTGRTGRIGHRGLASSFYSDRDEDMASVLTRTLMETNQEVPDFLQSYIPEGGEGATLKFEADSDFEDDTAGTGGDAGGGGGGWGAGGDDTAGDDNAEATGGGWGAGADDAGNTGDAGNTEAAGGGWGADNNTGGGGWGADASAAEPAGSAW